MQTLSELHSCFLRERNYLDNVSPRTIRFLHQSWNAFTRTLPDVVSPADLDGGTGLRFIEGLRTSGTVGSVTTNTYIRGVNTFLSWLHRKEMLPKRIAIRQLRVERTIPPVLDEKALARLIGYKPKCLNQRRVHAIVMTIIDGGFRVNEVITLRRDCVDMDAMTIKVMGKGRRERMMPFSLELRRILFRWTESIEPRPSPYLFPNRDGGMLTYRNLLRDYALMLTEVGIERGSAGGFHRLRHSFATAYMRNGGNQFYLQRMLGHADIKTTAVYVHAATEDLRGGSILARRNSGALMRGAATK